MISIYTSQSYFFRNDVVGSEISVFEKLEQYVQQQKPGAIIKEVNSDGLCVVRSFQESLQLCYNMEVKLSDVLDGLRSEILNNHSFYAAFSSNNINVLCELDMFLKDPLKYYKCETVDLFIHALGNAYDCRVIIFRANQTNSWTTDLSVEGKQYDRVLYFAMTDLNHMDLVINCDSKHYEEESDSEINR